MKTKRRWMAIVTMTCAFVVSITSLEGVFRWIESTAPGPFHIGIRPNAPPEKNSSPDYALLTPKRLDRRREWGDGFVKCEKKTGFCWMGSSVPVHSVLLTTSGSVVWDAHYTIGPTGRRYTPASSPQADSPFVLFLGCSMVFGSGLDDAATLPNQMAMNSAGRAIYNFGVPGFGPSDVLLQVRRAKLSDEIRNPHGIVVYYYIDDHLARLIGPMSTVSTWGADKPYITEDGNGGLIQKGTFASGRPIRTRLYQLLARSHLFRRYFPDFPPWPQPADLELFARVIRNIRDEVARKLKVDAFYVVLAPGSRTAPAVVPYLEAAGIRYIDYSSWDLWRLLKVPPIFPGEGHPSVAANAFMAKSLAHDLFGSPSS